MRFRNGLLVVNILSILLVIIITFYPSSILRIILGLPFVLFFPGYTMTTALFPKRNSLDSIERIALSFGLSIAVVVLIGFMLNYTPWGIKPYPILISVTVLIVITSIVAWYRQRRLSRADTLLICLDLSLSSWRRQNFVVKILSSILIAVILGAMGTLGYVISTPRVGEKFTEFYILGLGRKVIDYPVNLKSGEQGKVIVGIVNHEHQTVNYHVEVRIGEMSNTHVDGIELQHEEKWEQVISFTPTKLGNDQKVEFLLYKNGNGEPYLQPLRFLINVKEGLE